MFQNQLTSTQSISTLGTLIMDRLDMLTELVISVAYPIHTPQCHNRTTYWAEGVQNVQKDVLIPVHLLHGGPFVEEISHLLAAHQRLELVHVRAVDDVHSLHGMTRMKGISALLSLKAWCDQCLEGLLPDISGQSPNISFGPPFLCDGLKDSRSSRLIVRF